MRRQDRAEWDSVRWHNREWLAPWEATHPEPSEQPKSFGRFIRDQNRDARAGGGLPWLITERNPATGRRDLIGQLTVSSITRGAFQSASIGYWVDGRQAGRGIAPMAVAMATDYCFGPAGLHRIQISIRPENAASLRVVEKLGFREEGYSRDYLHIAGAWADHRCFALTAPEVPQGLVRPFTGTATSVSWSGGRLV
ncbi:GNAT family N-acetyltransferase [Kocuria coralli]|uniref:GNAT family N-acetyltransferase n=2 Tax=Kocuria coralli TaxID=1461025 RepID=A0A5J5KVX3_9MICC|nr:GNAT family N-acetyltransferase [Kocuria coralli]